MPFQQLRLCQHLHSLSSLKTQSTILLSNLLQKEVILLIYFCGFLEFFFLQMDNQYQQRQQSKSSTKQHKRKFHHLYAIYLVFQLRIKDELTITPPSHIHQHSHFNKIISIYQSYNFKFINLYSMKSNGIYSQNNLNNNNQDLTFHQQQLNIACLEIELGQGQNQLLHIKSNDDPYQLALIFCKQHRLNQLAVQIVKQKIQQAKAAIPKRQQRLLNNRPYEAVMKGLQSKSKQKNKNSKSLSPIKNKNENTQKKEQNKDKLEDNRKNSIKIKQKQKQKEKDCQMRYENLYIKSIVNARKMEDKRKQFKQEKEKAQMQNVTFKPTINTVSQKIIQFRRESGAPRQKNNKQPQNPIAKELKQCTFKPKINQVSQIIIRNSNARKEQVDHFQTLYRNKTKNKFKNKQKQYNHQPKLNQKSNQNIKQPFLIRLQQTLKKKREQKIPNSDYAFVPKICRAPKFERNKQKLPIGQYLYQQSTKKHIPLEMPEQYLTNQSKVTNQASNKYYQQRIQNRILQIFQILDNDSDGLISPQRIGIQNLSQSQLIFLRPILMQMDELNAQLNLMQFRKAVMIVIGQSDLIVRSMLVYEKRNRLQVQQQRFIPQINKRSKQLIQKKRSNKAWLGIYEQGLKGIQQKSIKLMKVKTENEQRQFKQCSFRPSIGPSSQYYIKNILNKKENIENFHNLSHEDQIQNYQQYQ